MSAEPSKIDISNSLFVITAAIFTSLLTEGKSKLANEMLIGISWYLIYRKPEYKSLTQNIENLQKRVEKQKDANLYAANKTKASVRKLAQDEAQLKQYMQDLSKSRMTGTLLIGVLMMIFMSYLSNSFSGIVVAKLPF